jgi:Uri superfamily endonuclease
MKRRFDARASKRDRTAKLKKERGVWVYRGATTSASISDRIDREREKRARDLSR